MHRTVQKAKNGLYASVGKSRQLMYYDKHKKLLIKCFKANFGHYGNINIFCSKMSFLNQFPGTVPGLFRVNSTDLEMAAENVNLKVSCM